MSVEEPFDFARYFDRVQRSPFWHDMHVGLARYAGLVQSITSAGLRVLDVGCGPGHLVDHLRREGFAAWGADSDKAVLRKLRANFARLPAVQSAGETLPFPDGSFNTTLAGNLLFFVADPIIMLREMVRVTRPGGIVAIWNPSERMNRLAAAAYAASRPDLDHFERRHLVNWAGVAEGNRRWSADDLASLFAKAELVEFETEPLLHDLARYGRGRVREHAEDL